MDTGLNFIVLHLSDIHFQSQRKFAANRYDQIARAVTGRYPDCGTLLVILSGDIANAGLKAEYAIATKFVADLKKSFLKLRPGLVIVLAGIAGNHDCDYTVPEATTRELLLSVFRQDPAKLLQSSPPLASVLSVQNDFRDFIDHLVSPPLSLSDNELVFRSMEVPVGRKHVRVHLLNTALGCERHKDKRETDQGKLFLPIAFLGTSQISTFDVYSITVFHHPLNWLESNNSSAIRQWVASSSDLILTGHEHEEDAESKDWISKEKNLWVQASALQEETGASSGFNTIAIDLDTLTEEVTQYNWQGTLYAAGASRTFSKTEEQRSNRRLVPLLDTMREDLEDPGTGYTHPSRNKLKFSDIYVQPKLSKILGGDMDFQETDDLLKIDKGDVSLPDAALTILIGETRAGKTMLAKECFRTIYDGPDGVTPLLMEGTEIDPSHLSVGKLARLTERTFNKQYSPKSWSSFSQLPSAQKWLIIDNWHAAKLNDLGKRDLLAALSSQYERILLVTNETTKIEESGTYTNAFAERGEFTAYKIRPFGHLLRSKLIRKWLTFGQATSIGHKELHSQVTTVERILDTVLGKSLLPAYPFFVLALLQTHQNIKVSNHANGSYGYLYESLITTALAEVSNQSSDVDLYYSVLGRIAWELFITGAESLTAFQLNTLINAYGQEAKTVVDAAFLANMLLRANILAFAEGSYFFRYRYIYYFFTARFLADRAKTAAVADESKTIMLSLVDSLTKEESANVIIFLIYLTRDADLLGKLTEKARSLFCDGLLFDADTSISFLSQNHKKLVSGKTIAVDNTPEKNRDAERRSLDSFEEQYEAETSSNPYEGPDSEFAQSVKLMDILGQAVRNFPGSMPGDIKVEITSEIYKLGLRVMSVAAKTMEDDMAGTRDFLAKAVRGNPALGGRDLDDVALERRVDGLVVVFIGVISIGLIKTVTSAVGLAQLRPVYDAVKKELGHTPAVELIDMSIALDHGSSFPKSQILALNEQFKDKWFARMILQQLVAYHFAMFHVDPSAAKSVGSRVGVDMRDPKVVAKMAAKK